MLKKALVEASGRIAQIVEAAAMFPVASGLKWVDVDDTVTTDHKVNGKQIEPPPARVEAPTTPTLEQRVAALEAELEKLKGKR
jgi:O-acetylhomoserine/O-acetylserine sulfhydrylase-like pyridoxal-dependent enzyme